MNENDHRSRDDRPESTPVLDLALLLAANIRLLILVPVAAVVLAAIVGAVTTPTYTATARAYLSVAAALHDQYVALLRSPRVFDAVAERFKLTGRDRAGLPGRTKASRHLAVLSVEVEDPDPGKSAELANAFVEELSRLTEVLAITDASQRRLFFERQMTQVERQLHEARASLQGQGASEAVLKKLAASPIDVAARLAGYVAFQEIRLSYRELKRNDSDAAAVPFMDIKWMTQDLSELRAAIAKLERATSGGNRQDESRHAGAYRDFRMHQTLYDLVAQQRDLARSEEVRLIQFLERARPAPRRSAPLTPRTALEAALVGFALALLAVLIHNRLERLRSMPGPSQKLSQIRTLLRLRRPGGNPP